MSDEPKWKTIEKIVALLETALSPVAHVEHNVYLPVIGRPDRKPRQCDIVIKSGQTPRQTITIVEVQKRKSKPNITTFHGWIEKMREVGAQHLICVSALGFPQSIIDDVAMRYGPAIHLATLEELEQLNIPGLMLGNYLLHQKPRFSLEQVSKITVEPNPDTEYLFSSNDEVFTLGDRVERLNIVELYDTLHKEEVLPLLYSQGRRIPDNGSIEVALSFSDHNGLHLYIEQQKYKVLALTLKWKIETDVIPIPLLNFEYKQEFFDGTLAWIASAKYMIDNREVAVHVVFRQNHRGFLQIQAIQPQGIESLALRFYKDEASWRSANTLLPLKAND